MAGLLAGRHLPALDGLRAIAVGVVVAYHAGFKIPGDLGVTGFFVLSGFLITWLLMKELDATGRISFGAFYLRRTLRIFPAYYVFIAGSLALDAMRGETWATGRLLAALFYGINYHNAFSGHEGQIAHAWSLAVEEQFYLLWPVSFLLLARGGLRRVRLGLAWAIGAVVVWRTLLYCVVNTGPSYVYNAFECRFDSLAIGCLIAAWSTHPRFLALARTAAVHPTVPMATIAAVAYSRMGTSAVYHYSVGFTLDSVLIGILIIQILQLAPSWCWRWLDVGPIRYLGRISYPIYLWHGLAIGAAGRLVGTMSLRFIVGGVIVVIMASVSYFAIERPALWLKNRLGGRESLRGSATQAVPAKAIAR